MECMIGGVALQSCLYHSPLLVAEWVGIVDNHVHFLAIMVTVSVIHVIMIANVAATISDRPLKYKGEN